MAQTKAALQAENEAQRTEIATLRIMVEQLETSNADATGSCQMWMQECEKLRAQLTNMASVASAVNTMQRPAYQQPQWQIDRAAAMAAAKAAALAGKCKVKVQA